MLIDRIIFVCTLLFTGAYLYGTTQIPSLDIGDPLGPKAFPYMITIGLLISAAWLLFEMAQTRRAAGKRAPTTPADAAPADHRHLYLIGAVIVWIALYYAVFESLGFLLATPVFLLGLMARLNRGKWLANTLTVVLFTGGTYVLFTKLLGVSLAKGVLGI